jgi:hypothetical protein
MYVRTYLVLPRRLQFTAKAQRQQKRKELVGLGSTVALAPHPWKKWATGSLSVRPHINSKLHQNSKSRFSTRATKWCDHDLELRETSLSRPLLYGVNPGGGGLKCAYGARSTEQKYLRNSKGRRG